MTRLLSASEDLGLTPILGKGIILAQQHRQFCFRRPATARAAHPTFTLRPFERSLISSHQAKRSATLLCQTHSG